MADEATLTIKIQDAPLTGTIAPPPRTAAPSFPDAVAPTAGKTTAGPDWLDMGTAKPPAAPSAAPTSPPITLAQEPPTVTPIDPTRPLPVSQTSTASNRNVSTSAALPPGLMNSLNTAANVATAGAAMNAKGFATAIASATALIPGFGSAISAASIAMLSLQGQIDALASRYSAYNGDLAVQVANQEMRDMFREMRRSQTLGPDVSRLYGRSTDFQNKMEDVLDNLAPALIAFADKTLSYLNGIASVLETSTNQETATGQVVSTIGTVLSASYQATEAIMSGGVIPLLRHIGRQNEIVANEARAAADRAINENLTSEVLNIARGLPQGAVGVGAFTPTPAPRAPLFGN